MTFKIMDHINLMYLDCLIKLNILFNILNLIFIYFILNSNIKQKSILNYSHICVSNVVLQIFYQLCSVSIQHIHYLLIHSVLTVYSK